MEYTVHLSVDGYSHLWLPSQFPQEEMTEPQILRGYVEALNVSRLPPCTRLSTVQIMHIKNDQICSICHNAILFSRLISRFSFQQGFSSATGTVYPQFSVVHDAQSSFLCRVLYTISPDYHFGSFIFLQSNRPFFSISRGRHTCKKQGDLTTLWTHHPKSKPTSLCSCSLMMCAQQ